MKPMVATYLLAGAVVAALLWLRTSGRALERVQPCFWHLVAWPFFLPALLAAQRCEPDPTELERDPIAEVERRLLAAAQALSRHLGTPLHLEAVRIRALTEAMRASAGRAEALQCALLQPGFDDAALASERDRLPSGSPLLAVLDARLGQVRQIRALWRQARADLELALVRAGELEGRLTLLRFEAAGPAVAAGERAREAAQAIEELASLLEEVRRE